LSIVYCPLPIVAGFCDFALWRDKEAWKLETRKVTNAWSRNQATTKTRAKIQQRRRGEEEEERKKKKERKNGCDGLSVMP